MSDAETPRRDWHLRTVPADLVERYRADGSWDGRTLGSIVAEGGPELAHKLEAEGYEAFMPAGIAAEGGETE